ncbi:Holliday junction resolvase [Western grey kangaroopox virus]|uniref:Holliday junction resolvase n=1 Tax=Western grey kangaroopox virus TaxID=1566307 RepID=A0A2C9DSS7_9POXV|nr:Holliday junction resolvase [Western grey kangaroopox virus]ATI21060.1 Holliday junction resolvase [Western grey kangaroopox virus]
MAVNARSGREIVCAFDLGVRNSACACFIVDSERGVGLVSLEKLDWSRDWEQRVAEAVRRHSPDVVVLEKQMMGSSSAKFVYFIKGLLYGSDTRVVCRNPVMRGGRYRDRKRASVSLFLNRVAFLCREDAPVELLDALIKLDDVADSFNLGLNYIVKKMKN